MRRSSFRCLSLIAGLAILVSAESASAADVDGDGVADELDNCRYFANASQTDSGGIATTTPDGIGDACQCGDVTNNGQVNGQDAAPIRRFATGLVPNPTFVVPDKCDVTGDGVCDEQDANAVSRAGLGTVPNPEFGDRCPRQLLQFSTAMRGEPAAPTANGSLNVVLRNLNSDGMTLIINDGLTAGATYTVFITESPVIGALPAVFLGQFTANGTRGSFSANAEFGDAHSPANQSQENAFGVAGAGAGDVAAGANTIPLKWVRVYQEGATANVNVFGVSENGNGGAHITTNVDPLP